VRIVLREDVRPGVVRLLATMRGWEEVASVPAGEGRAAETVWAVGDGHLHLVERDDLGLCVLVLKGDAVAVAGDLRASLHTVDVGGPLPADPAEAARALNRAAGAAGREPDPALTALLSAGLSHRDADVRRVALYAIACVGWPDLRAAVAARAAVEPDLDVAAYADDLLSAWGRSAP
jgi:hypothetical protein